MKKHQSVPLRIFILLGFTVLLAISDADAATYYTRSTGDVTGSIWGATTTGAGSALPALANGDIIYIDDNVTISTNYTGMNVDVTIYLNATVDITGGKWNLGVNSSIIFQSSSAKLISTSGGNSDKVKFGTANTWSSTDPDLTGPGTMDKTYTPAGGLPVELIYFKALIKGSSIRLGWSTASELNFHFFELERSINGKDFASIGKINGHGTSTERHDYTFLDEKPLMGKNYYRLTSVDFDGYTESFEVISQNFTGEKVFMVVPNPSDGITLGFNMNFIPDGNASVTIYDNLSNVVGAYTPSPDSQSISFSNSLRSGVYYVKLISDDYVKVERFIVQ